ncbi:MAG: SAM-dependent methyltransferase [Bacteroidia bacterium]|jgi:16S rRNA (cytidine1402-2'-O)-methyltransferase
MTKPVHSRLFLIPNILAEGNGDDFLPDATRKQVHHLKQFIVENEKSARALIKRLQIATPQAELSFRLWNEHNRTTELKETVDLFENGDVGLISEAGIPCVADPGAEIVAWAHGHGVQVVPLPGSSSIFMALMASGFNGQSFTFHGYLPIEKPKRAAKIKQLLEGLQNRQQTQIFMEAPYRNNALMEDLLKTLPPSVKICVACNITSEREMIRTMRVEQWRKQVPDLHKQPALFLLGQ